jgi:hypothetical protein
MGQGIKKDYPDKHQALQLPYKILMYQRVSELFPLNCDLDRTCEKAL